MVVTRESNSSLPLSLGHEALDRRSAEFSPNNSSSAAQREPFVIEITYIEVCTQLACAARHSTVNGKRLKCNAAYILIFPCRTAMRTLGPASARDEQQTSKPAIINACMAPMHKAGAQGPQTAGSESPAGSQTSLRSCALSKRLGVAASCVCQISAASSRGVPILHHLRTSSVSIPDISDVEIESRFGCITGEAAAATASRSSTISVASGIRLARPADRKLSITLGLTAALSTLDISPRHRKSGLLFARR